MIPYETQIKAIVRRVLDEVKADVEKVEGEIVHVAKADFESLVARVEALETKAQTVVVAGIDLAAKDVKAEVVHIADEAKAEVEKL